MPPAIKIHFEAEMPRLFTTKANFACFYAFLFENIHRHDGLLTAGGVGELQNIFRYNYGAVTIQGSPGKENTEIIICGTVVGIPMIEPLADNRSNYFGVMLFKICLPAFPDTS